MEQPAGPGRPERIAGSLRTILTRGDPLVPVVGGISLLVYALHGIDGKLSRDLAVYGYAGQQFADGVPAYEGILNRAGPLAHMVPGVGALAARLLGLEDLTGMRLLYLLISVACTCVVYLFARDLFDSRTAALCTAFAFLTFGAFIEYASYGPREKTPMTLFLLCSLWAAYRRRWVGAGVWLGLATLTLQIVFPVGAAAILVQALAVRGERIRALVRTAVGGLVVLAVFIGYFTIVGALDDFIEGFWRINARYTQPSAFTDDVAGNWHNLQYGYAASLWVAVAGIVAILAFSLLAVRPGYRERHPSAVGVAALGAATAVALVWTLREYDSWPDAMLVLPTAAFGIGVLAAEVEARVQVRWARPAALAWVLVAAVLATSFSVGERNHGLVAQRSNVKATLRKLPSATILAVNSPQALVLSGKTNPIRYQMFSSGMNDYLDDTLPGGLAGLAERIGRVRPTLITFGNGNVPPWFAETLHRYYAKAGKAPGWVWYVDCEVGHRMVMKLRHPKRRQHDRAKRGSA